MNIEIINSIQELLLYKNEWEAILEENENDNVFLELDWILLWWKYFGKNYNLFMLLVTEEKNVTGFCPFMIRKKHLYKEISFIGGCEATYMDFILKTQYRKQAIENIIKLLLSLRGSYVINIKGLCEDSVNYSLVYECLNLEPQKYISKTKCYFYDIEDEIFEDYYNSRFSKNSKSIFKSKERKLERLGKITYKRILPSDSSDIEAVFLIHDKRWLRKIGNSSFSRGTTKEFYTELLLSSGMSFNTIIDVIKVENKIISFLYGYEYKSKYLSKRIAHDDDYYFSSPGQMITKEKVKECFEQGIKSIDFGLGDQEYKERWTNAFRNYITIIFPAKNLSSKIIFLSKYLSSKILRKHLKEIDYLKNFKQSTLGKIKYFCSCSSIKLLALEISNKINRIGIFKAILYCFRVILCYERFTVLEKDLRKEKVIDNAFLIRKATFDDVDTLALKMKQPLQVIIRRLANMNECFLVFNNDELIYYCWIKQSYIDIPDMKCQLRIERYQCHLYDAYMEKNHRIIENYKIILSNVFNILYEEGFKKCFIIISNCTGSLEKNILKSIYKPIYEIHIKKLFSKVIYSRRDIE